VLVVEVVELVVCVEEVVEEVVLVVEVVDVVVDPPVTCITMPCISEPCA
jgi:hypothetical protein